MNLCFKDSLHKELNLTSISSPHDADNNHLDPIQEFHVYTIVSNGIGSWRRKLSEDIKHFIPINILMSDEYPWWLIRDLDDFDNERVKVTLSINSLTLDKNLNTVHCHTIYNRAVSRLSPSQWEMSLQNNAFSSWLGVNIESALYNIDGLVQEIHNSSASAMELRLSCTNPAI